MNRVFFFDMFHPLHVFTLFVSSVRWLENKATYSGVKVKVKVTRVKVTRVKVKLVFHPCHPLHFLNLFISSVRLR